VSGGGDAADAQQRQIRALFDEFDRDKKGRLTLGQFEEGLTLFTP
jgi:Ca2+-binding EF-hand superfamily protein